MKDRPVRPRPIPRPPAFSPISHDVLFWREAVGSAANPAELQLPKGVLNRMLTIVNLGVGSAGPGGHLGLVAYEGDTVDSGNPTMIFTGQTITLLYDLDKRNWLITYRTPNA